MDKPVLKKKLLETSLYNYNVLTLSKPELTICFSNIHVRLCQMSCRDPRRSFLWLLSRARNCSKQQSRSGSEWLVASDHLCVSLICALVPSLVKSKAPGELIHIRYWELSLSQCQHPSTWADMCVIITLLGSTYSHPWNTELNLSVYICKLSISLYWTSHWHEK